MVGPGGCSWVWQSVAERWAGRPRRLVMLRSRCLCVVATPVSALRKHSCGLLRLTVTLTRGSAGSSIRTSSPPSPAARSSTCRRGPRRPSARSRARARTRRRCGSDVETARSVPATSAGSIRAAVGHGHQTSPFSTSSVDTRRTPPGWLCRMPFSTRLASIRSSSAESPRATAGSRSVATVIPAPAPARAGR